MISIASGYETLAFFGLAGGFEILERFRPREIDRWKHMKIDVLSFALAILINRISQHSITGFLEAYAPAATLGGWFALQGLPASARIFLAIMLADFVIYWIHRAQHSARHSVFGTGCLAPTSIPPWFPQTRPSD